MRKSRVTFTALAVIRLLTAGPAGASIIDGNITGGSALSAGGDFLKLTLPLANPLGPWNSVGNDTFQDNNLYGFDEAQNVALLATLLVDVGGTSLPLA
ncbi:MAG: hypothetical protein EXQ52_11210 [Bryobacterales bacterium]|nr:hypothetical protein [Bryobacterales bacterium]